MHRSLAEMCADYLLYASQLESRFVRRFGEVLSFGNGDCGQLAHGTATLEDMVVRCPRRILSLRDKKITTVSCGGLHNVAVTADGVVYTWGCNDDGSLGRTGDENQPLVVPGLDNEVSAV
eukprot:scaffold748_cov251-Pinguiococcus_pyrenoidosus.AAC.59